MRKPRAGSRLTPIMTLPRPMRRLRRCPKSNRAASRPEGALLAEHVQCYAALVRPAAMLEQVDRLPGTKAEPPVDDGNGQMDLGEGGAQVRGHIVRAFVVVLIERCILGNKALEERLNV